MSSRRNFLKVLMALPMLKGFNAYADNIQYLKNPALKSLDHQFKGNPFKDGIFLNLDNTENGGNFWKVIKWKLSPNPKAQIKSEERYQIEVIKNPQLLETQKDFICWLGHASYLIQLNGKRLLTDPCLTAPPLMDRLTELPFAIEGIDPDYLLISHGHYDHLDADTLKQFQNCKALVPLKMAPLIEEINPKIESQEAGWFQQYGLKKEPFNIYFLPAYHWYRRTLNDKNTQLWGSFIIETSELCLYFGGDSGYAPHFKTIQEFFPKIDIAMLPVGAYEPRWMMKNSHMNPQEALKAYDDLGAQTLLPMHYGTFDLTDEPMGEPESLLRSSKTTQNLKLLKIGEPLWL